MEAREAKARQEATRLVAIDEVWGFAWGFDLACRNSPLCHRSVVGRLSYLASRLDRRMVYCAWLFTTLSTDDPSIFMMDREEQTQLEARYVSSPIAPS
jgi:hypothetical protein